jgi:hypothetical protein
MKLPADTIIAPDKVTRYLLVPQARRDKSRFLKRAGYTMEAMDHCNLTLWSLPGYRAHARL